MTVAQFHWEPSSYLELMRCEVPEYEVLQDRSAAATGQGAATLHTPSWAGEQLRWLADAGLLPSVAWARRDLAVLVGRSS